MLVIFLRFLKDKRLSIIIFSIAGIAMLWMYVAMYPSIQSQAESFSQLLENYPEGFMKAFGIESLNFNHLENFIAIEHFSIVWPLMIVFLLISFASNALARDIEKGTIELVLARPVSRLKIFWGRYASGMVAMTIFVVCSIFATIPLAKLHGIEYQGSHYVTTAILGFLFGWAIFSIAMMLSAFFSDKGKVAMIAGGMLIIMYVVNIISALKENLSSIKYISFFYYFVADDALIDNVVRTESIIVFALVAIVCTVFGAWRFAKRDIAV